MSQDHYLIYQLPGEVYWALRGNEPTELALPMLPGWAVLTPIGQQIAAGKPIPTRFLADSTRRRIWATSSFCLRRPDADSSLDEKREPVVSALLNNLRLCSHHVKFPYGYVAVARSPSSRPPPPPSGRNDERVLQEGEATHMHCYRFEAAITWEHFHAAVAAGTSSACPIFIEVLLDALDAHVAMDFRKSLLFAAMAVEIMASEVLDKAYEEAKTNRPATMRMQDVVGPKSLAVTKDPIYEALLNGARFAHRYRLHELPLYLWGRSLLLENAEGYRKALKLHATRNEIGHAGAPDAGGSAFDLNPDGSQAGLEAAVDVFRWFGVRGPFPIWELMKTFHGNLDDLDLESL